MHRLSEVYLPRVLHALRGAGRRGRVIRVGDRVHVAVRVLAVVQDRERAGVEGVHGSARVRQRLPTVTVTMMVVMVVMVMVMVIGQ